MKLTLKTEGYKPKQILLDDKDISSRLVEAVINIKDGYIPTVTLELIPDAIEIDGDFKIIKKDNDTLNLGLYEQEKLENLNNKYWLKECDSTVKELKQDLINLYKDEKFLRGYNHRLDYLNFIFKHFVTDYSLYLKEKITLEDLEENK